MFGAAATSDQMQAIESIIQQASQKYNVSVNLIKAIIQTESGWNVTAYRWEPSLNDASMGLMQILLSTAKWQSGNQNLTQQDLNNPAINIDIGTKYLAYLMGKYGSTSLDAVISAYNGGHPLQIASGGFVNQDYVDKVNRYKTVYDNVANVALAQTAADTMAVFTGGSEAGDSGSGTIMMLLAGGILLVDIFNAARRHGPPSRRRRSR